MKRAVLAALLALPLSFVTSAQTPPRDPPPTFVELARQEAELKAEIAAQGLTRERAYKLASLSVRQGKSREAFQVLDQLAALEPGDSTVQYTIATYIEEHVRRGSLSDADKLEFISKGIAAADSAIALDPMYGEAIVYKNILLRHQARLETNRERQTQLINEADALLARAKELMKQRPPQAALASGAPTPPAPPLPPGSLRVACQPGMTSDGQAPVRVGGNIPPPAKTKDLRPIYPPEAMAAGVQGVVIMEVIIDQQGRIASACVLRSVPGLDDAALDAVSGWEFTPTLLNGAAVPVIMTVSVNFTLK